MIKRLLIVMVALLAPAAGADFSLRLDRLTEAFRLLPEKDQPVLDQAIRLVQQGEHAAALLRLTDLNKSHPTNSSLRVLTAYAMIQAGNLLGAYAEAEKAHHAPNGNSYKCWFYAKIALLTGNDTICRRELEHARKAGDMPAEVKTLEQEMKARKRKG